MHGRLQDLRVGLFLVLLTIHVVCPSALAQSREVLSWQRDTYGLTLKLRTGVLSLTVFSPRVIRVLFAPEEGTSHQTSLAVTASPNRTTWRVTETSGEVRLNTDVLESHVNRETGAVSFHDRNGQPVLAEGLRALTATPAGNGLTSRQDFLLSDDEAIYGLGQHQLGLMNYRHTIVRLQQQNMLVAVPGWT